MDEEEKNKAEEVLDTPDLTTVLKEIEDIKGLMANMQEIIDTLQPAKEEDKEEPPAEETPPEEPAPEEDDEDLGDLFKD